MNFVVILHDGSSEAFSANHYRWEVQSGGTLVVRSRDDHYRQKVSAYAPAGWLRVEGPLDE